MTEFDAKAQIEADVSRETLQRLEIYAELLRKWQLKVNLVANGTLKNTWARHFLDSLQLMSHAPNYDSWLDLGSGGGFPGLVCAIAAQDFQKKANFACVESDTRKCAFLREVARQTGTEITIHNARIEALSPAQADIVSARALAPLPKLLPLVQLHLRRGGTCLLQKGSNYTEELETVRSDWQMNVEVLPSKTAPDSVILRIRTLSHV